MVWSIIFAAVALLAFSAMSRRWPCNPGQPNPVGREFRVDLIYFLMSLLLYGGLTLAVAKLLLALWPGVDAGKALATIQDYKANGDNADLKALASKAAPLVQHHLDMAVKFEPQVGGPPKSLTRKED